MLGSSALMFHLSQKIVAASTPDVASVLKANPEVR